VKLTRPIRETVTQSEISQVTFRREYLSAGDLLRARRASTSKDEFEISLHLYASVLGLDVRDVEQMDVMDIDAIDAAIAEMRSPKV
jgi:hypothetical protein